MMRIKSLPFITLFFLGASGAFAQITVNQSSTTNQVQALVENVLLGSCVTVSNVNYIGPASAAGTFNATGTTFAMQNGILLTTGSANTAIGPDDDNNAGVDQGRTGDANLTSLAGVTTYDAVILEFDFVPQDDSLSFRYVFASEEYPEWVNSQYNDVFGFFISGPGISGPYVGNSANIALIPNTTTPVAINNVNNGYSQNEPANGPCENCAYYVENHNGPAVQYDGYTTVLTAKAVVTPCQTYHIRLAIADAGDHIYDSGVFLEAGSFTAGGGITVDFTNTQIEEGCSDEYIVFSRVDVANNGTPISATYSVSGTATNGVDYNSFPTTVTIPAGQNSVIIPIVVPLDFIAEGIETIVVNMDQPPCDCLAPGSATINVIDNDVPLALTTTGETTICLGQSANLTANVSGSLPPYSGSWDNGAPVGANVTVSPANTTTYTYTVTDACNSQTQTSTETVTVIRPDFNANDPSQCFDGNSFAFSNTGTSGGTVSHYWTFGDGNSSTQENPTHSYGADGSYTVTHFVIFTASACTTNASESITVFPEPVITATTDANVICAGGTEGAISTSISGGTAAYGYVWTPGGMSTANISSLGVGNYSVVVTDANGCTDDASASINQNDPVPPTITCPATANITTDAGLCTSSASIGTATSSDNCGVQSTIVDNAGPYSVGTTTVTWTATDFTGNTASCSQDVVVTDDEAPSVICPATANISTDAGLCTSTASIGTATSSDNCGVTSTLPDNSGPYSVGPTIVTWTATDVNGNTATCTQDVVVSDDENPSVSCPATANISTDAGLCTSSASIGTVTSSDNCGVASTLVDNSGPYSVGTTTVTWTATDVNGNTATCSQDVVVSDDEDPSVTCPATANISTDAGLCSSSSSIGTATSSDNCGVASTLVDNAGPYSVGTTTVTWTATDVNGNTATCTQDVVVSDDEDPTILGCPSNIDVTPASNDCTPVVTWNIPQADDNCSASLSSTHNSGDSFPVGTTTVTYTATDLAGNTFDCSFDVTITPSVLVLAIDPSTVNCGANVSCNGATDGTATANVSGGCLPYSYDWSDGQTTETATGLAAGTYTVIVTDANGSTETELITLAEPDALEIDGFEVSEYVGGAGVSCNGAPDGEIDITVIGGATCQAYSFSWTGPNGFTSSSEDLTGLEAGSYTVTIEDVNGCSTTGTYTVSEPDALVPTCTSEDALCNGDANGSVEVAIAGGTSPYTYAWSNGNTDASQSELTAGTYGVTVTDANGCIITCSSVVGEPNVLNAVVTAFDETLVNGCNGSAIATPTGGTAPYSYEWSDGQTDSTAIDLCDGIYSITVTDANGCEFTTSVVINPPTCDLDVDVTASDVSCNDGSDGTATATPLTQQNNTPFTYLWNNSGTTQTINGISAGPYSVVVTDSIGCQASGSVVVSEPTALSVGTSVIDEQNFNGCDGSATANPSGGTPPYDYAWNDADAQTTQTASDLCPGTYTVTVTDANGCDETVTITVNPLLCTGFSVAVNTERLSCFQAGDGSATAIVTGGTSPFTYSWNNAETTSNISGLAAGSYTVTVVDDVNCSQTVSGNVTQPALLEAATAVDNVSCNGVENGVVELTVTGGTAPYVFDWDNGATSEDLEDLGPGIYNVLITDDNGCTTTSSGTVTQPDTLGASSIDVDVSCNAGDNGSIDLTPTGGLGPYLYTWSTGAHTQDISDLSAGTYSVTFADQNGCLFTYETTISEPDALDLTCSSEDALCNGDDNGTVEVSVAGGTAPFSYSWSNGSTDASQTGLVAGTYVVTVTDENGCVSNCSSVVGEPDVLNAVVVVQDETLVNGCNGSATANPIGGTPPYTYEWSDGQTTQTAVDLCAGTYTVIVTDANECEFTTSNIVNPPSCDLDVDVTGTDASCNDGEDGTATATPITVQNNTPFTYLWNNSGTTQTIDGITAGPYSVVVTDSIGCEASGSVVISEPTALSVSSVVVDEQTFNGCDGSATANPSGGTPPYSYDWSDGQSNQTATDLCPGTYTVTVTDANGCDETITITVNPLLCTGFTVAINTQRLSCFQAGDGSATAVVTGGTAPFTYSWSNGGTDSSISGLAAGQYTVTVVDAVNCSQTVSGNVTQPALLEAATAVDNVSCHGVGNGVVELTVTGGTAPYVFDWDNGATTEDLNNIGPGSYNVLVTDENGCTVSASATVTEPDTLQASSIDINPTCFEGNDGSIDLTVSGGLGPYLVSWDNGGNTADISGLSAGTYVATIVDQNGCIYTYSTTLTEPNLVVPTITADGPIIFCEGDSVTLTASENASYSWSPNGETTQSITVYDAGDYSVSVVTEHGCNGTSAATSVTMFQVDPATIDVSGPTEFCQGASVTLSASQGSSYAWLPNGETTSSITVSTSGTYSVTVTDVNGCESTSAEATITVYDLPVPTVTADGPLTFCEGGSVTLTSSEAESYAWAPFGQTTQSVILTESGIYRVTVTDENGCQGTSTPIQVVANQNPEPVIIANGPTQFCEGGSVELSGPSGFIYNWSPNGETNQSILVTETGDYQLTVTDEQGCTGISNIITVTNFDVDTAQIFASGPTEFCEGKELALTASSASSYLWAPSGETSQIVLATTSGAYSVTITDANGCISQSDTIDVIAHENPTPIVSANGPLTFCEGDSVVLTTGNFDQYDWHPNSEISSSITVSEAGDYWVVVTDQNGCTGSSDTVSVGNFTVADATINVSDPTEFCQGGSVTLSASQGSSYAWLPNGETTSSITITTSGTYSVTVTDVNGCESSSAETTITVYDLPVPTVTADGPLTFCEGGSVTLTSSVGESYAWAPFGQTTQSVILTESGIYRVTITDENGCQGTSTPTQVIVNESPEPVIVANGPTEICRGGSITLTSSSADSYDWTPNGETTQSITVDESGVYSVTVVDANGCEGSALTAVEVVVFEPDTVTISVNGPTEFCEGGEVILTASSASSYSWLPNGETDQSISVTQTGSYTVTATDQNGCSSTSASIDVTVFDSPTAVISASGTTTFCEGDSVTLTAPSSSAYLWEPGGETTQSITVFNSGSYSLQVADANTCVGTSDTVEVLIFEVEPIQVSASGPTSFCDGGDVVLTATGGQSYLWEPNGEQTQSITVSASGEYVVTVVDANGCSTDSDTTEVNVFELPTVVVSVDGPNTTCEGDTITLSATSVPSNVSYQWFDGVQPMTGEVDSLLNVFESSTYSVTVTDANGCSDSDNAPVLQFVPVPVAVVSEDQFICASDSITLIASGGDNYLWSNGSTGPSITVTPDSATVYTVTVSNQFCSITSSDSVAIGLYPSPNAVIETNLTGMLEVGHLFTDASGDTSITDWFWEFGDGEFAEEQNPLHPFSDEGFFNVVLTVTNEFGCTDTASVEVEITQVIDIPNVFTPNHDGYNDNLFIDNFGVIDYELTIYNRWGMVMHYDKSGEIFWDGRTPAGEEAKAGTYYYVLKVKNEGSLGNLEKTGTVTLIR